MLEDHLKRPNMIRALRTGAVADQIDAYIAWLVDCGYRTGTIFQYAHALAQYTRWAAQAGHVLDGDGAIGVFDAFVVHHRRRAKLRGRCNLCKDVSAARIFTRFLVETGRAVPAPAAPTVSDRFPILGEYVGWVLGSRGLQASTLRGYLRVLGRMLVPSATNRRA